VLVIIVFLLLLIVINLGPHLFTINLNRRLSAAFAKSLYDAVADFGVWRQRTKYITQGAAVRMMLHTFASAASSIQLHPVLTVCIKAHKKKHI
jgi:hypothetical protein